MYYLFKSNILSYRNGNVQAKLTGPFEIEAADHWNDQRCFAEQLPPFQFEVRWDVPHPDNYFTGANLELYSGRLLEIFQNITNLKYETFETEIIERKKGKKVLEDYRVFRLLHTFPFIDPERTTLSSNWRIENIILHDGAVENAPDFFRDRHFTSHIFVSERLKNKLENQDITGCQFQTLEEYIDKFKKFNLIVNTILRSFLWGDNAVMA